MNIKTHQCEEMKFHIASANVASINITPLWPHESMDWHLLCVWMFNVDGI
jgi:hypothetical protein